MKKLKIAIFSFASCEGCQIAILDLGEKFFELLKFIQIGEFRLIEGEKEKKEYDITFVEGIPIKKEEVKRLKEIRKKSKLLVVLGNCAALGGVAEIKNYQDRKKTIRYIFKHSKKIANPEIKEVDNFVKVDFTLPGCPINAKEFLQICYDLLKNKPFKISENPVCYECQIRKYKCLLQEKEICLGPVILGGCEAICLKSEMPCWGCRGLLKNPPLENFLEIVKKIASQEEISRILEVFGLRDELENKKILKI